MNAAQSNSSTSRCILLLLSLSLFVVLTMILYMNDTSKLFSVVYQSKLVESVVKREHRQITSKLGQAEVPPDIRSNIGNTSDGGKHTLLIWTPFFEDTVWSYRKDKDPFKNTFCNYDNCQVTYDKSQYTSADVILYHCRDDIGGWPASRPQDQLYGVFCLESSVYSTMERYENRLNITLSYRRDSDVFTPYHHIVPRHDIITSEHNVTSDEALGVPSIPLSDRPHDIVWPVSHCRTGGKREVYAKELGKYMSVDIFGACGTRNCPRNTAVSPPVDPQCEATFKHNYKFYLSFENSYCTDYITEKFFRAYWMELIPIVFGRTDYKKYYPPHSFIDIRDYRSPKILAKYLKYLSKNETAFNEYFAWKKTYMASRAYWFESIYCGLCDIMNNKDYSKTYPNLQAWWANENCDDDIMNRMKEQW